ncbi:MAG: hypothetical protein WA959_04145 [Rivularia sp. (in: cyanobacteria)]
MSVFLAITTAVSSAIFGASAYHQFIFTKYTVQPKENNQDEKDKNN